MARPIVTLNGKTFGNLTVLSDAPEKRSENGKIVLYWNCRCVCGTVRFFNGGSLKRGNVRSCGCSTSQFMSEACRARNPEGRRQQEDGYVLIRTDDGWKLEHRCVMEQKLGRQLLDTEEVHHKNGIRCDNHPDNLELWLKAKHPKGARLEDLIKYAIELLQTHRPELLKP